MKRKLSGGANVLMGVIGMEWDGRKWKWIWALSQVISKCKASLRRFAALRFEMPCDLALGVNQIEFKLRLYARKETEMSANVYCVENRKNGEVYVNVNLSGMRARFSDLYQATNWLHDMKIKLDVEDISVFLREIVITARKELKYESCYSL